MNPTALALRLGIAALALAACNPRTQPPGPPVYWYGQVEAIVQDNCQGCHLEGGIAPFALETYAQARANASVLAAAVLAGHMPPWMPAADCQSFQDARRLSQVEIDTLVAWANGGALEGDPALARTPPGGPPAMTPVHQELAPAEPHTPAGTDDYHCFVLDPALASNRFLTGVEVRPGVRTQVHHVILYAEPREDAVAKESEAPGQGWTCFGGTEINASPKMLGGWVPGSPPMVYPAGTGIELLTSEVIILQVHYNTEHGHHAEPDTTQVALQYASGSVRTAFFDLQAQPIFALQPNTNNQSVDLVTNPPGVPVTVYGLLPHMHKLGRRIKVEQLHGGGGTSCLIDIPRWDFHWQQLYFFQTPVAYGAGDRARLTCTWDNTTPNWVAWGEGSSEEMCLYYAYVTVP